LEPLLLEAEEVVVLMSNGVVWLSLLQLKRRRMRRTVQAE